MSTKQLTERLTADEQIRILEEIARDEENYARDRIAAVKVLIELGKERDPVDWILNGDER